MAGRVAFYHPFEGVRGKFQYFQKLAGKLREGKKEGKKRRGGNSGKEKGKK